MNNEYAVLVKGFKTQEQADTFIKWYEGQGEQDAQIWFEENDFSAYTDLELTYPISYDTILDGNHNEVEVSKLHLNVKEL
jgi:hypothetical protein